MPPDILRQRFDPDSFPDFLAREARPTLKLTALMAFGSVTTTDRFDLLGEATSDIDLLGIVRNHFGRNLSLPGFTMIDVEEEAAQVRGNLKQREIHAFLLSEGVTQAVLDEFVEMANGNDPQDPRLYNTGLWEVVQRLAHGTLVSGSLPQHPFFDLLRSANAPTAIRFLRRDFNPFDSVDPTQRIFEAFS